MADLDVQLPPGARAAPAAASAAAAAATAAPAAFADLTAPPIQANKAARTLFVGGLPATGEVPGPVLEALFNAALAHLVPDPVAGPPVLGVRIDPGSGRFGFVELRMEALAVAGLALAGTVMAGSAISVTRSRQYMADNPDAAAVANAPAAAAALAALAASLKSVGVGGGGNGSLPHDATGGTGVAPPVLLSAPHPPGRAILLSRIATAAELREDGARRELEEDVRGECSEQGCAPDAVSVPPPPLGLPDAAPGRCYALFADAAAAAAARAVFHGRAFDGVGVVASYVPEADVQAAAAGAWLPEYVVPPPRTGGAGAAPAPFVPPPSLAELLGEKMSGAVGNAAAAGRKGGGGGGGPLLALPPPPPLPPGGLPPPPPLPPKGLPPPPPLPPM